MSKEKEVLETVVTTEGFEAVTEVVEEKGFAEKAKAFTKAHWKKAAIGIGVVVVILFLKKPAATYDVVATSRRICRRVDRDSWRDSRGTGGIIP